MSICGGGAQLDSAKLSDWLQVIGLFAVVASLIFVGLQMKQTDAIALSEIYQERAVASREHNLINSSNPNFLSGSAKLYLGKQRELTAQEAIALEYDLGSQLVVADNYLQQYEWGFLSEAHWSSTIASLKCNFEHPWYREVLNGWPHRPEFQAVIDKIKADAIENPTGCWDFEFPYPIVE
jgi:hypothetical protein